MLLPSGCANPIQSPTRTSSTGATAGSGQLLPIQGSRGFIPEVEAFSQTTYQLKEPFVLTRYVPFPYREKLGQAFPLSVWFF